jgi:serine/threonine protein kinase/Tol biopolymer transport system component
MTIERGELINDRYRIAEILGQGGMAAVYRAIDENLGVEVALKENLFTTEEYARQFRLEAVILASLRHTNLPRVTDHFVIEQQGQYLVMDYIEGEDLRMRMDRIGQIPENEIIVLGVAICSALTYLHSREPAVLHRDIKPGNVKITPQGSIFLVDFGLAKVMETGEVTTTGARAMTPGYSPPEQYGTARTDHRSDVYSLGATLYSALTNALPEDGLARAMGQAELTPITKHNSKVTRRLATGIEKALEVQPDDRYQSAEDFKDNILRTSNTTRRKAPLELLVSPPPTSNEQAFIINGEENQNAGANPAIEGVNGIAGPNDLPGLKIGAGPPSQPPSDPFDYPVSEPRRRGRYILFALFIFLILLFAGSAASYYIHPVWPRQALAWILPTPTPTITPTRPIEIETENPATEPTSTHTTQATTQPTKTEVPTQIPTQLPTSTESPTPRPSPTPTITPSPTQTGGGLGQIAFTSDRSGAPEIWLVDVDGSGLTKLTDVYEGACQPDWSPDGKKIVFISPCRRNQESYPGSSLFILNLETDEITPLPSAPGGDYDPDWSSDGTRIAFTSLRNGERAQIYVINLGDNSVIELTDPNYKPNTQPDWSPNDNLIAYIGGFNQVFLMSPDGANRHLLTIGGGEYKHNDPDWSPDGQVIAFTRRLSDLSGWPWLVASTYAGQEGSMPAMIPGSELTQEPDFSPDGFWLAFVSWPDGFNHDIYIMTPSGVNRTQLTTDPAYDFDPAWRPILAAPQE